MKRYGLLILIAVAACSPQYKSGKTQCSNNKECPSGYSCKDDGTNATHYCFENKILGCSAAAAFYCSQSNTCWPKPGVCSTVTYCGTAKNPDSVICATANYHPDCNGTTCLPNSGTGAGGAMGTGGATAKGGAGGTIVGVGGALGTGGGMPDSGMGGTGGIKDAGPDGIIVIGGGGATGKGGAIGTGGIIVIGSGGATGRGGSGGTTSTLCSGTAFDCSYNTSSSMCAAENGCTWINSTCSGTPDACSTNSSSSLCVAEGGCIWNSSTASCSGTPTACSIYSTSTVCVAQSGCTWGWCSGTPSACSTYSTSTYCLYNGCSWAGALTCSATTMTSTCSGWIATDSTSCEVCQYSSCCGQLTNCLSDTNCSNNESGTLWNTFLDCWMNCCGTACNFN